MDKTITVHGTGKMSVMPDRTEVTIELKSLAAEYEPVLAQAAEKLSQLRQSVQASGLSEEELKTRDFRVQPEFEYIPDDRGRQQRQMTGYSATQQMVIQFTSDSCQLTTLLTFLAKCPALPEFSVRFTLQDPQKAADQLLETAALDARKKAEALCRASGVRLGALIHIEYQNHDPAMVSPTAMTGRMMKLSAAAAMPEMSLEPQKIELTDTASFVWELV